jgi:hypothetical protein
MNIDAIRTKRVTRTATAGIAVCGFTVNRESSGMGSAPFEALFSLLIRDPKRSSLAAREGRSRRAIKGRKLSGSKLKCFKQTKKRVEAIAT